MYVCFMKKWLPYILLTVVFVFFFTGIADAQCSQCKLLAGADETIDDAILDHHKGNYINDAILYIMLAPYVLLGIAAFVLRKKVKRMFESVFFKPEQ